MTSVTKLGSRAQRLTAGVLAGLALLWGAASLQGIFIAEREDANAALEARRNALQQYARTQLERQLQAQLAAATPRIDAALADPLSSPVDLLFVDAGQQRLPRVYQPLAGSHSPATRIYEALTAHDFGGKGLWGERLTLLAELQAATRKGAKKAITGAVRELLDHESRFTLPLTQEFAARLFFLEHLSEHTEPDPSLSRALLLDGLSGTRGRRLVGLQPLLVASAHQLTESDFGFLKKRVSALSRAESVPITGLAGAFGKRTQEPVAIPTALEGPSLIDAGHWFVVPLEERGLRGVAIDAEALLSDIAGQMRNSELLANTTSLQMTATGFHVPLSSLELSIEPDTEQARAIANRYLLKTGVGSALVLLLLAVGGLSWLLLRRERQLLDDQTAFVASVTHELRTPLASLRLMGETLEKRLKETPEAKDFPTRIVKEAERLNFLVENILTFNRLEKSRVSASLQSVSVEELVADAGPDADVFSKREVKVRIRSGGEICLKADPDLVRLLLTNLLSNACKYNRRDSVEIEVSATKQTDQLLLLVSDNGTGIDPEDRENVFTEFFRSKGAPQASGFGLGLALCRRIMDLHDGTIVVRDSSQAGTTFELAFPRPTGEA